MAQNVNEAIVGVTGAIYSFPTSETIAYGANEELPQTAIDHGYANEDGVSVSGERSTTNIYAWQNATLVRTVVTEASVTYTFTLLQTNEENSELYYGKTKNSTTGGIHWDPSVIAGKRSFVIDVVDLSADKKLRYYIPEGEVTETGSQTIQNSAVVGYEITITAYRTLIEDEYANTIIWEGSASEEEDNS